MGRGVSLCVAKDTFDDEGQRVEKLKSTVASAPPISCYCRHESEPSVLKNIMIVFLMFLMFPEELPVSESKSFYILL